jgi:hypothetical protein
VLFERFVSPAHNEPPDIDVGTLPARGSRRHCDLRRLRSAIREFGKGLGLSVDLAAALAAPTCRSTGRCRSSVLC